MQGVGEADALARKAVVRANQNGGVLAPATGIPDPVTAAAHHMPIAGDAVRDYSSSSGLAAPQPNGDAGASVQRKDLTMKKATSGGPNKKTGSGAENAGKPAAAQANANGNSNPASDTIFTKATPAGAAKKVSEVLGEIVWLMSQSPLHKQFFISDLEWFVMTPIVLQQFRLFYDETKPIGVVLWASVNEEVEQRLVSGPPRMRPQDWKSGDRLWAVEVIAPFGGAEEMVKDLKAKVFKDRQLKFCKTGPTGRVLETM